MITLLQSTTNSYKQPNQKGFEPTIRRRSWTRTFKNNDFI